MKHLLRASALLLAVALSAPAAEPPWRPISDASQPLVEIASNGRELAVRAEAQSGAVPKGRIVACRARAASQNLSTFPAKIDVTEKALGPGPLRLWMGLRWTRPDGSILREEAFFSPGLGPHPPAAPEAMQVFDLAGFVRESQAEALRIRIPVDMPADGKATIVLDDADGRRVRNVANAIPLAAGRQFVEWDGRREDGTLAAPGEYRVRVATHPGFAYEMLPGFGNGGETQLFAPYGPNHTAFRSLVARPGAVSASSFYTEGGNSTVVLGEDGRLRHGWGEIWTLGNEALFHVSGAGDFFYAIREARRDDPANPGAKLSVLQCFPYRWSGTHRPGLRVDTPDAKRLPGERNALRVAPAPASGAPTLAGAAFLAGRLYVSDRAAGGLAVYPVAENEGAGSAEIGARAALLPLADPGPLCPRTDADAFLALSGRDVFAIAAADPAPRRLCTLAADAQPTAMAARGDELFALLPGSHQIHVFSLADGSETRRIGEPGGPYQGPWRRNRLVNPTALCLTASGDALWVTEERMSPKRLSRWDPARGECVYEKLGSESYGSPGAGMDPEDPDRWIAQDCEWRLDRAGGGPRVVSVLHPESREGDGSWNVPPIANRTYRWVRRGGRTFVIGNDAVTTLYEYRDARLVPLALVSTPGIFSYRLDERRHHCRPLLEAYRRAFPDQPADRAIQDEATLMVWIDRDADGLLDADEFSFLPQGTDANVGFWGLFADGLDIAVAVTHEGRTAFLRLDAGPMAEPGSPPAWDLARAWSERTVSRDPLPAGSSPPRHNEGLSTADGSLTVALTATPLAMAWDRDGRLRWQMKNPFPNVHGSHAAPLPVPGELQGVNFTVGSVPLPAGGELFAIIGNHGRAFFVTADGLLLDELFTDCRVSERADESCIGGEAFGGSFQIARRTGDFILQAGGGGFRRYRITGPEGVRIAESTLRVDAAALAAAERLHPAVAESARVAPSTGIPRVPDGAGLWDAPLSRVAEWSSGNWHMRVDGGWDASSLLLRYLVWEPSPWVNNGEDPFLKFKTGDCVDLHLGVPGLLRLLVAPRDAGGGPVAALYRHRLPAAKKADAHPRDFNSPWRSYTVDDATLPSDVAADTRRMDDHYEVALRIPLATLGLDAAALQGSSLPGDFGVVFGDSDGTVNLSRSCWANKETGLVNDVPGEMIPAPDRWGALRFEGPRGAAASATVGAASSAQSAPAAAPGRLVPAGFLANSGAYRAPEEPGPYPVGPVWDAARGVLLASCGRGRIGAWRLDGTRVALHELPGAPDFSRFDAMTLCADGSVFVLAGGSVTANSDDPAGGVLYRIPADAAPDAPAERLDALGAVNAISLSERDGRLMLHRRRREIAELDTATLEARPVGELRAGGGLYLVCMMDWDPSGVFHWVYEHKYLHTLGPDGREAGPARPLFGPREVSMQRGRFLGRHLWALSGDTVKRLDAATFRPDPGVVHGGSSGAFLGEVAWNHEMRLEGLCEVSPGLYAAHASRNGALYLLAWNGATRHLDEVRRIGALPRVGALLLDDAGAVFADGLVWRVGDSPLAPPRSTGHSRGDFGGAALPDGTFVAIDLDHGRAVFRHGPAAELGHMGEVDARLDLGDLAHDGPFAGYVLRETGNGFDFVRYDAEGRGIRFALGRDGCVRGDVAPARETAAPPLPAAALGAKPTAWAMDGDRVALVHADTGLVRILQASTGRVLAEAKGLDRPDRVALRGDRLVVHEAGPQRLRVFVFVTRK